MVSILVVVVMCGITSGDGLLHCVGVEGFLHARVCQAAVARTEAERSSPAPP